jgi:hypothetical protein
MNDEKKIAKAVMEYALSMEECLIEACKDQGLSENMWALLSLAVRWINDTQLWAEDVLARRRVIASVYVPGEGEDDERLEMLYGNHTISISMGDSRWLRVKKREE